MNLLLLTNNLNVVNGITTFLYQISKFLIKRYNCKVYIISCGGDNDKKFKELGVTLINKKFFNYEKRNIINFILASIFCGFVILKYKIDIVNPQINFTAAFSYYISKIFKKPFIQTVHYIFNEEHKLKLLYGKNFFSVNNYIVSYIKKKINNANIFLVRCPFEIEEKPLVKDGKIKFISTGRLVKEKCFEVYLTAISLLDKKVMEKAEFYIAGDGDNLDNLKNINNKLNINVKFLGKIYNIDTIYEKTHIFVMSTCDSHEGLGLGIIQAALKKNLIITPAYYSINELIEHGKNGFIFKMNDADELASILKYVVEEFEKTIPLIENLYIKLKQEFSFEKNVQIIYDTYYSLL